MAKQEVQKTQGTVDKGLEAWQTWNKFTLTAEGTAIVGGLLFGVPWLIALGAAGAAIDGVQIVAINHIQEQRKKQQEGLPRSGTIYQKKDMAMAA